MNYKVYLYVIFLGISIFALSGVNFNQIIKKNHSLEARVLVMLLAIALSYLVTNYVCDFIS